MIVVVVIVVMAATVGLFALVGRHFLAADADGYWPKILIHAEPVLMLLSVEMIAVIESALIATFQDGRLFLIGTDAVTPMRFSMREFQDADTVCADGTME